jgi:GrpB-like predicted nucleotidyltransferase (UPF0157 family)
VSPLRPNDRVPVTDQPLAVVPYDPDWPRRFEVERAVLERVLAPWLEGGIHHIGSTAVAGLAAKPIIDMLAGVRDLEEARAAFDPLREHSYVFAPHRPREGHHLRSRRFACPRRRTVSISRNREALSGASGSPSATPCGVTPRWPQSTRR